MIEKDIDKQLVANAQAGDRQAFDALVLKYQHRLTHTLNRFLPEASDVSDVLQDTFMKAFRALPNFRNESAFYTWLYRIAMNSLKNHAGNKARLMAESDIDFEEAERHEEAAKLPEDNDPEALLLRDEVANVLFQAVNDLPEDLRSAIVLRELEGFSYEEIAAIMHCPIGTVRSRIFRAREAINEQIERLKGKEA